MSDGKASIDKVIATSDHPEGSDGWKSSWYNLRVHLPGGPHEAFRRAHLIKETLSIIEGRWKFEILCHLFMVPVMRFSELHRTLRPVSQKVLSSQLRELERDGILTRKVYPTVPMRVDYALTERGFFLGTALKTIFQWGEDHLEETDATLGGWPQGHA